MTRDAQLAGWVCDCQENKKENEEEIHGQQTDKFGGIGQHLVFFSEEEIHGQQTDEILLELGNIFFLQTPSTIESGLNKMKHNQL